MDATAKKTITTRTALTLIQAIRNFATSGAEVRDLHRIADVAEEIAIDAEEKQEDRLAAEALKKWAPRALDVIEFKRVDPSGAARATLTATVLKTPEKGSRRICVHGVTPPHSDGHERGTTHIMIKRIVGVVSRAPVKKGSRP